MSIEYVDGNIFDSKCQVLVNPVNCRGVMGAGLALEFKNRFPEMFEWYAQICKVHSLLLGSPVLWNPENAEKWVLLFPTKKHWKHKSKLENIEKGLQEFCRMCCDWGIESVAWCKLGCGLGGLSWEEVHPLMVQYLTTLPLKQEIYL